jgi:hypothetical protein
MYCPRSIKRGRLVCGWVREDTVPCLIRKFSYEMYWQLFVLESNGHCFRIWWMAWLSKRRRRFKFPPIHFNYYRLVVRMVRILFSYSHTVGTAATASEMQWIHSLKTATLQSGGALLLYALLELLAFQYIDWLPASIQASKLASSIIRSS